MNVTGDHEGRCYVRRGWFLASLLDKTGMA